MFAMSFVIPDASAANSEWFAAAQNGEIAALEANRGPSVDEVDLYGRTALLIATRYGQLEVVKWLLEHGANPNQREMGEAPSIPMPDIKGRKSWYSNEDRTPLMHALIQRHAPIANLLLDAGADPKAEDRSGTHMLYYVCDAGVAERLLRAGLDPRKRRSKKNPYEGVLGDMALPLTAAVKCEDPDLVRLYLQAGADPNARADMGRISLHFALRARAPIAVIRVLVEGGADVNARANRGETPLMVAAEGDDPNILVYLLEHGAKVDPKTEYGQTAMDWVRGPRQEEKRRILQDAITASVLTNTRLQ